MHPQSCGASLKVGTHLKLRNATVDVPVEIEIPIIDEGMPTEREGRGRPKKTIQTMERKLVLTAIETVKAFVWKNGVETCCVVFVSVNIALVA